MSTAGTTPAYGDRPKRDDRPAYDLEIAVEIERDGNDGAAVVVRADCGGVATRRRRRA